MIKRLPADQKLNLIKRFLAGESISSLCKEAKISRTIFYRWLKEYKIYQQKHPQPPRVLEEEHQSSLLKVAKNDFTPLLNKSSIKKSHDDKGGLVGIFMHKIKKGNDHWRSLGKNLEKVIVNHAIKNPSHSAQKISSIIGISSHGVWNVLKRNSLSTLKDREAHIQKNGKSLVKTTIYNDKLVMVRRRENGESVTDICREFGVSRTVFYRWLNRLKVYQNNTNALKHTRPSGDRHWRFVAGGSDLVLQTIIVHPEYSLNKLTQEVKVKGGEKAVGRHAIFNILRKFDLTTYEKRLGYAKANIRPLVIDGQKQELILPSRLRYSFLSFLSPPISKFINSSFGVTAGISFITGLLLIFAVYTFIQTNSLVQGIGLGFAFMSLIFGIFFFLYSLKYYLSIAFVLSFSRKEEEEDGQRSFWSKVFGISIRIEREGQQANIKNQISGITPFGLKADLTNVILERNPFVSIHVSTYNEKRVIDRLLTACTSFDYSNYEVIVADDSTDETVQLLEKWAHHPRVKISHRSSRKGYKGAALSEALKKTNPRAEFVMVFDADFIPYPDTITQFLKYFQLATGGLEFAQAPVSSNIAAVQGYQWHVLNKSENWITRGVRSEYSGSYVIERSGTEIYQGLKQISGSVYMIRKEALNNIGWGTSITEDFELTLKLYEAGYKVVYTPYIQAPAEAVSTIKRLIRQRMRWAEGHSFNVKRMFKRLLWGRWIEQSDTVSQNPNFQFFPQSGIPVTIHNFQSNSNDLNIKNLKFNKNFKFHHKGTTFFEGSQISNLKKDNNRLWVPSPLTFSEKLELIYLTPYYLQAAFFILGTLCWFMAEAVFQVRLPFWTEVWGWSLVATNLFALPLMNMIGMFMEESDEHDYLGLFSFIVLSYIVAPFQAYAAVKGFLEKEEGPWFRTPKTGRITDTFLPGRITRFVKGLFGSSANEFQMLNVKNTPRGTGQLSTYNPYLALATANNLFNNFKIKPKKMRWVGKSFLALLLLITTLLVSYSPYVPYFIEAANAQTTSRSGMLTAPGFTAKNSPTTTSAPKITPSSATSIPTSQSPVGKFVPTVTPQIAPAPSFIPTPTILPLPSSSITPSVSSQPTIVQTPGNNSQAIFLNKPIKELTPKSLNTHKIRNNILKTEDPLEINMTGEKMSDYKVEVRDRLNNKVDIDLKEQKDKFGDTLSIRHRKDFRPGMYKLKLIDKNNQASEQEFYWGVLAINANKSVYIPGDKAYLQMAVLDKLGHTLCDSDIELEITSPNGEITKPGVTRSDTCGNNNVTDSPDYYSYYDVKDAGTYTMKLTNKSTNFQIEDTFNAADNLPFIFERTGATRINPSKSSYKMNLKIKATQEFNGNIIEQLPEGFEITDNGGGSFDDKNNTISWNHKLAKDEEINLSYVYQAPKISPMLYLLGPLKFVDANSGNTLFMEAREWQIASDAVCNSTGDVNWNAIASWSCGHVPTNGAGGDDVYILTAHTVTVDTAAVANSVTINSPGVNLSTNGISISTGQSLTIDGNLTYVTNSSASNENQFITMNGTGNITVGGNLTIPAPTVGNSRSIITCAASATGTLAVTGSISMTSGAAAGRLATITGLTCTISANGITITGGTSVAAALNSTTGTITTTNGITFAGDAARAQLTTTGAGTINLSGTMSAGGTVAINSGTTIHTTGTTALNGAYTLRNLAVDSGTTTTGAGTITVSTIAVASGAVLTLADFTFTATSTVSVTGTLNTSGAGTTTKTFSSTVTVNATGTFDLTTANPVVSFAAAITNNSANEMKIGSGATTFAANLAIAGSGPITFAQNPVTLAAGRTLTISNTNTGTGVTFLALTIPSPTTATTLSLSTGSNTNVTNALTFTSNAVLGVNQTITMNGTANINAGTLTINAPTNTGASNITCAGSATGKLDVAGALTITGNSTTTGTVTMTGLTCTIEAGGIAINGGSTAAATINSTTGTITTTNGITFGGTAANARLTTTGAGTVNLAGTLTAGGTLAINAGTTLVTTGTSAIDGAYTFGHLTISSGTLSLGGATMTVAGNWTNNSGSTAFSGGANDVIFTDSGGTGKTIGGSALTSFPDLRIGNTTTAVGITLNTSCTASTLTFDAKGTAAANQTLTHATGIDLTVSGAVTLNQPTAALTSTWAVNDGTATVNGSVDFAGSNVTLTRISRINLSSGTLTMTAATSLTFAGTTPATKVMNLNNGTNTGTVNIAGSISTPASATSTPGTGSTWNFNGTAAQSIPVAWGTAAAYANLSINNTHASGATVLAAITATNVTGNLSVGDVTSGSLFYTNNMATTGANTMTFEVFDGSTFEMRGTATYPTGFTTYTFGATSTVRYLQTTNPLDVTSVATPGYGNLELMPAGTATYRLPATFLIQGNLVVGDGNGAHPATVEATTNDPNISFPGNVTVAASSIFTASDSVGATLDVAGNISISGTFNAPSGTGATSFTLGGNFTNDNVFNHNSGLMTYDGTNQTIGGSTTTTFYNITFSGTGTSATTANINVENDFVIGDTSNARTLDISSDTVTIGGNFTKTANSTFTVTGSTVVFNDASKTSTLLYDAATTFSNLTVTTGLKTIQFDNAHQTNVTGTLSINGGTCDTQVSLISDSAGNRFEIYASGSVGVQYAYIKDSAAVTTPLSATNSINGGNITGWTITDGCGTASDNVTSWSFQRKTFYDSNTAAYWRFSYDGDNTNIKIEYNLTPWSGAWTATTAFAHNTSDFSVWRNNTTVFIAYSESNSIMVSKGTLGASSITWDTMTSGDCVSGVCTALSGTSTTPYRYAYVTRDATGNIWALGRYYNGTNYYTRTVMSTGVDTLTGWGSIRDLSNTSNTDANCYGVIASLGSGNNIYAAWIRGTSIEGAKYTGSWSGTDSIATGKSGLDSNFSLSSDTTNALHLAYIENTSNKVEYIKYNGTIWGSGAELDANAGNTYVTVSVNSTNNDVYVIYLRSGGNSYYSLNTGSWSNGNATGWTMGASPKFLTSNYSDPGRIFGMWTSGTGPYTLNWNYIIIPEQLYYLFALGLLIPYLLRKRRVKRDSRDGEKIIPSFCYKYKYINRDI